MRVDFDIVIFDGEFSRWASADCIVSRREGFRRDNDYHRVHSLADARINFLERRVSLRIVDFPIVNYYSISMFDLLTFVLFFSSTHACSRRNVKGAVR